MEVKQIARPAVVTAAAVALFVAGCKKDTPAKSPPPDPLNSLTKASFNHRPSGWRVAEMAPMLIEQFRAFPDSYNYKNSGLDRSQIEALHQEDHLNEQQIKRIQNNLVILCHAIRIGDVNVCKAALRQLGRMNEYGQAAVPAICRALSDSNTEVRLAAAKALDDMYCADLGMAAEILAKTAIYSTGELQKEAADALDNAARDIEIASPELIDLVTTLLDAKEEWAAWNALRALRHLSSKGNAKDAVPKLVDLVKNGHRIVKDDSIELIAKINPHGFPLAELSKLLGKPIAQHNRYGGLQREAASLAAKLGHDAEPLRPKLIAILFDKRGTKFLVPQAVGQALHAITPEEDYSQELIKKSFSTPFPIKCSIGIALTECDGPNLTAGARLLEMIYYSKLANEESRKRAANALSNLRERAVGVLQPKTLIDIANNVGLGDDYHDSYDTQALRTLSSYGPELSQHLDELELIAGLGAKQHCGWAKAAAAELFSSLLEKIQGREEFKDLQARLENNLALLTGKMPRYVVGSLFKNIEEKHPQLLTRHEVRGRINHFRAWQESYSLRFPSDALKAALRDAADVLTRSY